MAARRQVCAPMRGRTGPSRASTGRVEADAGAQEGGRRGVDGRLAGLGSRNQAARDRRAASSKATAGPVRRGDGWRRSEGRGFGRLRAGGPRARRPITGHVNRAAGDRPSRQAGALIEGARHGRSARAGCMPRRRFWNG